MTTPIKQTVPFSVDSMASRAMAETVVDNPTGGGNAWRSAAWRLLDDNGWIDVRSLASNPDNPYRDRFFPMDGMGLCDGAFYVDNGDGKVSEEDLVSVVVAPAVAGKGGFKPEVRLVARIWESGDPQKPRVMLPEQWPDGHDRIQIPEGLVQFLDFIKAQEGSDIGVITSMGHYVKTDPASRSVQWIDGPLAGAGFCSRLIVTPSPPRRCVNPSGGPKVCVEEGPK